MREELLKGLTEEQIERIKNCKGQEEILKIAKEEGVELTDDQLEAVSGGCGFVEPTNCPHIIAITAIANLSLILTAQECFNQKSSLYE